MRNRLALSLAAASVVSALVPSVASAQDRVLGLDVSYWQGEITQSGWNTAFSDTGGERKFVFIRSSRGGTTGLDQAQGTPGGGSTATLSHRYDDSRFIQNIVRATSAGLMASPYHFARPDVAGNTGADEAAHFIESAGAFMRPGYLPPMFDLEAGQSQTTPEQLAQFSVDFSNHIYAVMQIRPSIYINGNYSNDLAGASAGLRNQIAQPPGSTPSVVGPAYPTLISARWPAGSGIPYGGDIQTTNPKDHPSTISTFYGPWDDYGVAHPWNFWQYSSGEAIPGLNDSTTDGDVAHGDIEYVRNSLIPAVWWNDSSGDWSTPANWNSGQPVDAPITGPGQAVPYATGPLPTARLPGAAGSGPTSGQYDTVILERPAANITVTLSTGTHNVRKMYMRETLDITGGTLTINYDPTYRPNTSTTTLHGGPISAQFSGPVTLSGTGTLNVHTLQVDATRVFTLNGGTLALNRINLMPHSTTPARIQLGGDVTINPLNNAAAVIANGVGTGLTGIVNLGGGIRTITVGNGSAATDLTIAVPVTNGSLTKAGAGTLALTAANTYPGNTTMAGGVLSVGATNHVGAAGNTLVFNGGTLQTTAAVTFNRSVTVNAGGGTFDSDAFNSSVVNVSGAGGLTKVGTGMLNVNSLKIGGALAVSGGGIVLPTNGASSAMLETTGVSVGAGALLQMRNNDMIVNYTGSSPEFALRDKALVFRNGAGTEGIGFTETPSEDVILAFGEASELEITSFQGVTVDGTTVVGKYTYYGDANFDGQVTTDDYVAIDLGLGSGNSWVEGDFDFNGSVTTDDYVVVDLNLGKGTGSPLAFAEEQAAMIALHTEMFGQSYVDKLAYASEFGWVAASVPEPGAMSVLALGAAALLRRRRR